MSVETPEIGTGRSERSEAIHERERAFVKRVLDDYLYCPERVLSVLAILAELTEEGDEDIMAQPSWGKVRNTLALAHALLDRGLDKIDYPRSTTFSR